MEGKKKCKLSDVNIKAMFRGQNELIVESSKAADDVISSRGQVMEYMYIPTGIKKLLVGFSMVCDQNA